MSLLPASLLDGGSTALPTFFFEARVHGCPDELITQLGLSLTSSNVDVAVFTRTSGVILVAGVGSYCAYRICARYLGKEFVWTMLDAARLGSVRVSQADSRLLHPAGEGFLSAQLTSSLHEERARRRLSQLLHSLPANSECASGSSLNELRSTRYRLSSTRSGSPIRVIRTANSLLRRALQQQAAGGSTNRNARNEVDGLGAIRRLRSHGNPMQKTTISTRASMAADEEDDRMSSAARSDLTSISRMQPPPAALRTDCRCYDVDGDPLEDDEDVSEWSGRSSAVSASPFLRRAPRSPTAIKQRSELVSTLDETSRFCIGSLAASTVGDEPSWDDEFASTTAVNPLFRRPSTSSDISELSAVKNLEAMLAVGLPDSRTSSIVFPMSTIEDSTSSCGGAQNLAELIQSKCSIEGASYMYQSCHLGEAAIETLSIVSGQESCDGKPHSHGLWELTSRQTPEKDESSVLFTELQPTSTLMTDSFISRSSASSGMTRSRRQTAMFDSAIGTDMMSSDDERSLVHAPAVTTRACSSTSKHMHRQKQSGRNPKTANNHNCLDKINEKPLPRRRRIASIVSSSIAPSEQSLEWFQESEEPNRETEL